MKIDFKWEGLKGARSGSEKMVDEAAINYQAAVKTLSNALRKEIRQNAPTDRVPPRKLPRTIRVKVSGRKWDTLGKVSGTGIAHLVEYGTKAHAIVPRRAQALKIGDRFAARVQHPGARPVPFFWPAVEGFRDDIEQVNDELGTKVVTNFVEHVERDR